MGEYWLALLRELVDVELGAFLLHVEEQLDEELKKVLMDKVLMLHVQEHLVEETFVRLITF